MRVTRAGARKRRGCGAHTRAWERERARERARARTGTRARARARARPDARQWASYKCATLRIAQDEVRFYIQTHIWRIGGQTYERRIGGQTHWLDVAFAQFVQTTARVCLAQPNQLIARPPALGAESLSNIRDATSRTRLAEYEAYYDEQYNAALTLRRSTRRRTSPITTEMDVDDTPEEDIHDTHADNAVVERTVAELEAAKTELEAAKEVTQVLAVIGRERLIPGLALDGSVGGKADVWACAIAIDRLREVCAGMYAWDEGARYDFLEILALLVHNMWGSDSRIPIRSRARYALAIGKVKARAQARG